MPALYTCSLCTYGSRHAGRSDSEAHANLLTMFDDRLTANNQDCQHKQNKTVQPPNPGKKAVLFFLSCMWMFDQIK